MTAATLSIDWRSLAVALAFAAIVGAWLLGRRSARRHGAVHEEALRDAIAASHAERAELLRAAQAREQELARTNASLERERRLFVAGPVVIFRWVAAEGWPVEYASPNAVGLFGHTADDFTTGRVPYASIVHPDDLERVAREVAEYSAAGVPFFEQDYRIIRADGETRWLYDFTVIARDATGRITHYEGYVLDATERRRELEESREMEARLHHAQKLESLGVLAGGIAHDFNNLLVAVLGNAVLARRELPVGSHAGDYIDRVESAAKRAAELAQQMLAYSGRAATRRERIDLSAVVAELADLLAASISKKAEVLRDLPPGLPPIEGDPAQLKQIVMNLVTNASDALGGNPGRMALRSGVAHADRAMLDACQVGSELPEGDYVFIEVADDGCGMSDRTIARIFEPFFTTKFVGRGLGMASVLGIVRSHGGAIRVDSAPGQGTRIRVLFPPAKGVVTAGAPSSHSEPSPLVPGKRVLVVDDEPTVRDVVCRFVERLGCLAIAAPDGEAALSRMAEDGGAIDCVLLDSTMPKLSGEETFRLLRARCPGLPVVLMSGYVESEATIRFGRDELAGFLQKPFSLAELGSKLGDVFAAQAAASSRPAT
ncbi:MAG: PAS domain-containing protein [Phycisphaerales bacterium]